MRAFIAADISNAGPIADLQQELMTSERWSPRDVKPVEKQNFHFTLIFLGEISGQDAERIKEKLSELQFEPFQLTLAGVGAFPKPDYARVVWIGVESEGDKMLAALAGSVVEKMKDLGFKPDKPFSPHLTILRAKRNLKLADALAKYEGRAFGTSLIDKIQFKKSQLTPSGPIYTDIYTAIAKS